MTWSAHPAFADARCFSHRVKGGFLHCYNEHQTEAIAIALDDIICILSPRITCKGYRLLFLQSSGNASTPETTDTSLQGIQLDSPPSELLRCYLISNVPHHLISPGSEHINIHIIISTHSGTCMAQSFFDYILQPLLANIGKLEYEVHKTNSTRTIVELCQSKFIVNAESGVPQTIVLLSGDGGLADIVDTFQKTAAACLVSPTIAIIPTGTGNAMANSLGLTSRPVACLTALLQGKPNRIPVFVAKFSRGAQYVAEEGRTRAPVDDTASNKSQHPKIYGAIVASWGLHAALVADSDSAAYRKFGADRFKMAAKELLYPSDGTETHKYKGKITFSKRDSTELEILDLHEHMYLLATLTQKLEKDFVISPKSTPLDGCLRVIHFGPLSSERAMELMSSAYKGGKHVHEEEVLYSEIEGLRLDFYEVDERWRRVCIDGKIVAVERDGWLEICKEPNSLLNILSLPCQDG